MSTVRPIILTLAGFDPTAGAGIVADIKTIEAHQCYGVAVQTANTIQTASDFYALKWEDPHFVLQQLQTVLKSFDVKAIKIGIVPNCETLLQYLYCIKENTPKAYIIWDTVLKSTTDFTFISDFNQHQLIKITKLIDLITPNYNEIDILIPGNITPFDKALQLSKHCAVLLKGGHNSSAIGVDYYIQKENTATLHPNQFVLFEKHGSGCVLSSAIASQLAYTNNMLDAVIKAKIYIEHFLNSNQTLLGYHDS